MDKKVVYVLTTQGCDFFSVMTRVSVASLRISNPDAYIIVACDKDSAEALKACGDALLGEIDELKVFDTPPGEPTFKNRFIKTNLRNLISGKFLFLDSDTLVRKNIDQIFKMDGDIAAAPNHATLVFEDQIWSYEREMLEALGWSSRDDVYVNGGVIFYNDTPGAYAFASQWHKNWLFSSKKLNSFRDQPALNEAIRKNGVNLAVLPFQYNAQVIKAPKSGLGASIWHFYSTNVNIQNIKFFVYIYWIFKGNVLDYRHVKNIINKSHPYQSNTIIDKLIVNHIYKTGYINDWQMASLSGYKFSAIKHYLKATKTKFFRILYNILKN